MNKVEGTGIMLDLSTGGCRVESPVVLAPGLLLELRIHVPDQEWPLMIERASVQWVSGQVSGLAFFQVKDSEQQRLGQVHEIAIALEIRLVDIQPCRHSKKRSNFATLITGMTSPPTLDCLRSG